MKKIIAMSLFALSTVTMFGGNIETNTAKVSTTPVESTDQQQLLRCYKFQVSQQIFVNNYPSNSTLVYDQTGLYTEATAVIKMQQLQQTYITTYNYKNGNGNLFTFYYTDIPSENCGLGQLN